MTKNFVQKSPSGLVEASRSAILACGGLMILGFFFACSNPAAGGGPSGSSNTDLSSLVVILKQSSDQEEAPLVQGFQPSRTTYSVPAINDPISVIVNAEAQDENAVLSGDAGVEVEFPMGQGELRIEFTVTAEDGTLREYEVVLDRRETLPVQVGDLIFYEYESAMEFQGYAGSGTVLAIPSEANGKPVAIIGKNALYNKSTLSSVAIPESVLLIGDQAFRGCTGWTGTLSIPNSVKRIGRWAFFGCSGFTGDLRIPESVESIGLSAFHTCSGFNTLILPDTLTSIPDFAFYQCTGLTGTLSIPSTVRSIGTGAFRSCVNLSGALTIPDSVVSVGDSAFFGCIGFQGELRLSASLTAIDNYAFNGCSSVVTVRCDRETPPTAGISLFDMCSSLTSILVPAASVDQYKAADNWSSYALKIGPLP